MKKLICVIAAAVICLTCVIPAFADMEGPAFKEYEAYISDPDGYTCTDADTDEEVFIPYNTKVTVTGEYDGEARLVYNDKYVSVSLDALTKEQPDVDASEAVKLSHPVTYIVIAEEGAKIRKGPAESYDELGTIPYNTEITVTYGTEDETPYLSWAYCTYDGVSGWIYVFQYGYSFEFATKLTSDSGKTGRVMTMKGDMRLTDKPGLVWDDEDTETGNSVKYVTEEIPAGTEFTYDKYYCDAKTFYAYVEYEGVKGWLECGDLYMNGPWTSHVSDDEIRDLYIRKGSADIYSEPFGKGSKTGTISEGEAAISYLQADKMISPDDGSELDPAEDEDGIFQYTEYIEYGGVKGWITYDDNSDFDIIVIQNSYSVKFNADQKIYKDENLTESAGRITAGSSCYWLDDIWHGDNGISVFLYNGNIVYSEDEADYNHVSYDVPNEEIEVPILGSTLELDYSIVNFEKPDTADEDAATEENSGTQLRTLIIVIAAAVVILFVTALVTIILIKKKKAAKLQTENSGEDS